ncbi:unnamed protein product [Closterium sp. Naga37s-1]|nr:unnamed protein product [Closterium sp. Naga37s-1]
MPRVPRPSASPILPTKDYASALHATRQLQQEQEDRQEQHVRKAKQQRKKSKHQQRTNNELRTPTQREERHKTSQTHQWRLGPQPSPLTEPLLGGTSQAGIAVEAEGASSRSGPQISSSSLSPLRWILPGFVSFRSQGGLSGPAVVPATHSSAQACAPASTRLPPPPLLAPSSATASPPPRPIASLAESSAIAAAAAGLALSGESSLERLETGGAAGGGEQQYATGAREWRSAGKGATAGGAGRGTAAWEGEVEGEGDGESGHAIARRLEWSLPVCKGSEAGRVSEECEQDGGKERSRKRNGQRRPILRWIWRSASVSSEEREGSAEREEGEEDEESDEGSDGSDDESDEREGEEEEREGGVAEAAAKAVAPVVSARRAGRGRSRAKTSGLWRKEAMVAEAKLQVTMAWPMMAANLLQNLMTLIPLAFVGRLGPLPLAAASIATSFANVTGHILLQGLASGLETLCGQAFGAGCPLQLGLHLQRALLCMTLVATPVAVLWWFTEPLLLLLHQSPDIAALGAVYIRWLLPSLAAAVVMQCLERYLQAQSVTFPMAACALAAVLLQFPLTFLLVHTLHWGLPGAAIAVSLAYMLDLLLLLGYIRCTGVSKAAWGGYSMEAFCGWEPFLQLALPSAIMLCLEYWSFDIVTLLAGLLPNPDIQVAGLSVVLNTSVMAFVLPYGFGVAVSTRVANELGAGDEIAAQRAATVGVLWALFEATLVSSALLTVRSSWGCVFSTSPEVVAFVAAIMPLLVASVVTDAVNAVLSGIVRGSGYQQVALVANLAAYYLFGLPLAALLAFYLKLGSVG